MNQEVLLDRNLPDYKYQFFDVDHDTFVSEDEENPVIISVDSDAVREGNRKTYRAIIRTAKTDARLIVTAARKKERLNALRAAEPRLLPASLSLVAVKTRDIRNELVDFDARIYKPQYKFAVLYAKAGQTTEQEFLNNGTQRARKTDERADPLFFFFFQRTAARPSTSFWACWRSAFR
jgi:hypothetical protein